MRPQPAYIEIVERTTHEGAPIIKPNEIRINGVPLLAPKDNPVQIHEMKLGEDVVQVTLTLFARRVVIAEEKIEENQQ